MKRLAALLAAAMLLLSGCGGKQDQPAEDQSTERNGAATMTIAQTKFSQETEDVLKLLEVKAASMTSRWTAASAATP